MKSFFVITTCALFGLTLSSECDNCSPTRKTNPTQDCILFANAQKPEFYQNEFLKYEYKACHDPEEIIAAENPKITCIPLNGNRPLLKDQECQAGEYKHYHWTIEDYDVINDNDGSSIEFSLTPCHGHPEIFIKPQILYAGIPMCQLFETIPETDGLKTNTWPFPNNQTGTALQGPDKQLFQLEKNAKQGTTVKYPGSFFSQQTWGHNGSVTSDDGRSQPQRIRIPSISYGGYFVSVYCKTASAFEIGIVAQKKVDEVKERIADKDSDSLAMKIRRFGYNVDDTRMDANWVDLKRNSPELNTEQLLKAKGYNCKRLEYNCAQTHYVKYFGLAPILDVELLGPHHPEMNATVLGAGINETERFCFRFKDPEKCTDMCCKWSPLGDEDIADFLNFGPFFLRPGIEEHQGICRPATTKQSLCVTPKLQEHMNKDNQVCDNQAHKDGGGCERAIQATMEVSFYTGEIGKEDNQDTWPSFQLQFVEMNDCVSHMDQIGQNYCWEADHPRQVTEFGKVEEKPKGQEGAKWSHSCGAGSGGQTCDPSYQARGKCFWDGSPHHLNTNTTRETQWGKNAEDCVMWTACGVLKNGLPVMIEHKTGSTDPKKRTQRKIPSEYKNSKGETVQFGAKNSVYIYGHVSDISRESVDSTRKNIIYDREVFSGSDTWLHFPPRRWVRVEVPVFNNVTYFFNVLRNNSGTVDAYGGVSAITSFYHQTQLYSDTTILIIAAVVVVALLFLLIPFIYTKQKIKEHLRKVYEQHKQHGQPRVKQPGGGAVKGDAVVNYAAGNVEKNDAVVYEVQDIAAAEKEDPALRKTDSAEPTKGNLMTLAL